MGWGCRGQWLRILTRAEDFCFACKSSWDGSKAQLNLRGCQTKWMGHCSKGHWTTDHRPWVETTFYSGRESWEERRLKLSLAVWTIPSHGPAWGPLSPSLSRKTAWRGFCLLGGHDSGLPLGKELVLSLWEWHLKITKADNKTGHPNRSAQRTALGCLLSLHCSGSLMYIQHLLRLTFPFFSLRKSQGFIFPY